MTKLTTLKDRVKTQPDRLETINPSSWRTTKATAHQRGYGYKWQKAREGWLNAHPLCAYCEKQGRVSSGVVVDHIIPHQGDMKLFWSRDNWQTLCRPCHDSVKKTEEAGSRLAGSRY